ncbi:MAG TPA: dockerin type I domain-containing protein [Pseudobacteroides sp.]|uniref:dockerin type I domain-containing protein n=1 Tax=Pseudobacteroides sp. TaxID=1968840 RepID=UPI002F93A0B5
MSKKAFKKAITMFSVFMTMVTAGTCINTYADSGTEYTVSGFVKPEFISSSSPNSQLSGFNITVEGTQISNQSDSKGYFELTNVPSSNSSITIRLSKAGYLTRPISIMPISSNIFLSAKGLPIDIWAGDFNGDIAINMADIIEFAKGFNAVSTGEKYKEVLDINNDGAINMSDIMIIINHFGKTANDYPGNITSTIVAQSPTPTVTSTPTKRPTATPTVTPTVTPTPTKVLTPTPSAVAGKVTYILIKVSSPTADQLSAYQAITAAMDKAVSYYNQYTNITLNLKVYYEPTVATADANFNGTIRFGKKEYMNHITAMHEIAHTTGVGTTSQYRALIVNGNFTGTNATNQLRAISGNQQDVLHGDSQHFWPYGLNYTSEVKSENDLINHCKIVNAMRKDMGF